MFKLLLILCFVFFGCGDDSFKKYAALSEFRVLGIIADLPEVADTTETVQLSAIVSDIKNQGREVSLKVEGCLDPGISTGEEIDCENGEKYQLISQSVIDLNTVLGATYYTGELNPISVTIPAEITKGRSEIEKFNGVDYLVIFTFSFENQQLVRSLKRIKVSTRPIKNSNPEILSMSSIELSTDEQKLSIQSNSSPEEFSFLNLTGDPKTGKEVFYLSWFSSSGEIKNSQIYANEETTLSLDKNLPDQAVIVVVLRDGRGGVDYLLKNVP